MDKRILADPSDTWSRNPAGTASPPTAGTRTTTHPHGGYDRAGRVEIQTSIPEKRAGEDHGGAPRRPTPLRLEAAVKVLANEACRHLQAGKTPDAVRLRLFHLRGKFRLPLRDLEVDRVLWAAVESVRGRIV